MYLFFFLPKVYYVTFEIVSMCTTQYRTYNINDLLFVFTFGLYQLFLHEVQEYFNMPVKGHSLVLTLLFETMGQMHKQ